MTAHLPRFQRSVELVDPQYGTPTHAFHLWWQQAASSLENQLNSLNASIEALAQQGVDAAHEKQEDIVPVTITADYTGAVTPSAQLPLNIAIHRYADTVDVTTSSTWSMSVRSGGITASINAGTGALTVTAITSSGIIDVQSQRTVNGNVITLTKPVGLTFKKAEPPIDANSGGGGGGSGGTTQTDSTLSNFNNTQSTVSDVLSVKAGSGGRVDLTAPLDVGTAAVSPTNGGIDVQGIWQWDSTGGGVWVDLGSATHSDPDVVITTESGLYYVDNGFCSVTAAKTGLTNGTTYKFRLQFKNNTNTRSMTLTGTATAAGS